MATNVKKFKYSLSNKALCVFLACVCFAGSVSLGILSVMATKYLEGFNSTDDALSSSFTESEYFENNLRDDTWQIVNYVYGLEELDSLTSLLESKREEVVNKAYDEYIKWQINSQNASQELYDSYYDDTVESTTFFNGDESINILVYKDDNQSYYFGFSPYDIDDNDYENCINDLYESFISTETSRIDSQYVPYYYNSSLNISVKYKDYAMSNTETTKEDALASRFYIYYGDGEFLYGGFSKELATDIINSCVSEDKKNDTAVCLYFNDFPNAQDLIFNYNLWKDKYASLENFHYLALGFECNRVWVVVLTVALMAISFALGFYFFSITGRKDDNDTAHLTFYDKLPFDIHFLINLAVGALLVYILPIQIVYTENYSIVFIFLFTLFAVAGWAVLFEFCSSVSRYAHSDRKFAHNFAVVKITKFFIKSIKKTNNRIKNGYRKTVSAITYKPKTMKAYIVALAAGYFVINAFLVMVLAAVRNNGFVFMFFALVLFAFNAMVIYYVTKFIKALDEIIYCAKTGEKFTGNRGKLPEILKIILDNMENTKEQLSAAVAKAVKDERLKTELITNVSHDLKTPLTSIISYVDLLSKCDIEDEKAKEYIGVLEEKGSKLKRLIEDLIEASKVTSGNITVNPTSLNLNELCIQAVGENQAEFEKHGLSVVVKESETLPVIFADGAKTFRILENLLSNAKKYSATGSRVYVSTYEEKGMGVFEIKNISAEPLDISPDELTERFVRGDKSRTKEGNGLGLSIAKELCNAQKGKLEISIDGDLFKAKVKLPLADKKPLNDKNVI